MHVSIIPDEKSNFMIKRNDMKTQIVFVHDRKKLKTETK